MRVKLEGDGKGLLRLTILQPVSQQGIVVIDDGRTMRTYLKDAGFVFSVTSPRLSELDPARRVALVEKNYSLKASMSGRTVAGRDTLMIVAIPKRSEMPERRLYIDRRNLFVLRHETIEGDQRLALLDTLSVSYPSKPDPDLGGAPPGSWKSENPVSVVDLGDLTGAQRRIGFRPILPRELPTGFVVAEAPMLDETKGLVGMRVTDGLAMATVYQWLPARSKGQQDTMKPDRTGRDGIAVLIVGAIPENVRRRLLDAYAPPREIRVEIRAGSRR